MANISLAVLMVLVLLIAAGSLLQFWITSRQIDGERANDHQAAVIIVSAGRFRSAGLRLLRLALDRQGFASSGLFAENYAETDLFQENINRVEANTGIAASDIWFIFDHAPDAEALQMAASTGCAGIGVVASSSLSWTSGDKPLLLPQDKRLALFYGLNDPQALSSSAREFFEWQTGEDASLFKGDAVKLSSSETYRSLDGSIILSIYPGLSESYAFISPFLISDIALTLTAWQYPDAEEIDTRPSMLSYIIPFYIRLALAVFMLLCIPPMLIINLRGKIPAKISNFKKKLLTIIIFWLPAIALSAAISIVFASVSGRTELLLLTFFIILPGAGGWIRIFASKIKGHEMETISNREAPAVTPYPLRRNEVIIPAAVIVAALILFWIWRYLTFGWNTPGLLPIQIFPVLLLFNISCGYDAVGIPGAYDMRLTLAGQWPYLALMFASLILMRGDMILSSFLITGISFWSLNAGKAAAVAARSPLAGSITCSLFMVSAWTIPPVLQGLAVY